MSQKFVPGRLTKVFSATNNYYMPLSKSEERAWGKHLVFTEQMFMRQNFFTGTWSVFEVKDRHGWAAGQSGSSTKKISGGLSFREAKEILRKFEETPKSYIMNSIGHYSFKDGTPMHTDQKRPDRNDWRNATLISPKLWV